MRIDLNISEQFCVFMCLYICVYTRLCGCVMIPLTQTPEISCCEQSQAVDLEVYHFHFEKFFRKNVVLMASVYPDPGEPLEFEVDCRNQIELLAFGLDDARCKLRMSHASRACRRLCLINRRSSPINLRGFTHWHSEWCADLEWDPVMFHLDCWSLTTHNSDIFRLILHFVGRVLVVHSGTGRFMTRPPLTHDCSSLSSAERCRLSRGCGSAGTWTVQHGRRHPVDRCHFSPEGSGS